LKITILALLMLSSLLLISYSTECRAYVRTSLNAATQTNVIYVPANYSTIQEAVNHAAPGDQIFVQAGTYLENVAINKSISLVGENRELTIINGTKTGAVINITTSNVNVTGFTIGKSGLGTPPDSGIFIEYSNNVTISNNRIVKDYNGITILFCSGIVISDNDISTNGYDGISVYSSVNVMISNNVIFSNFYNGISFYSSGHNIVSGNTISGSYYGIRFTLSSDNTIYHNNFGNRYQVSSDSTNIWDSGNEGNYWSSYTGQDLNGDGIGDLPYSIDENSQDHYPLVGSFSDFSITLNAEYHVTVICNSIVSNFRFKTGEETGNRIVSFNATGEEGTVGFCRIKIPTALMNYPFVVLVGNEEIIPTLLGASSAEYSHLYFTYLHSSQTVSVISSKVLALCLQLSDSYISLQTELHSLNRTYYELLSKYDTLLENNTLLQEIYRELSMSYQEHLVNYSENVQNIQNLMYIFAATTAVFLITTVYLSKRAHASTATKAKLIEEK